MPCGEEDFPRMMSCDHPLYVAYMERIDDTSPLPETCKLGIAKEMMRKFSADCKTPVQGFGVVPNIPHEILHDLGIYAGIAAEAFPLRKYSPLRCFVPCV